MAPALYYGGLGMGFPAGLTGFGQLPAGMPAPPGLSMPAPPGLSMPVPHGFSMPPHGNLTPAVPQAAPTVPVKFPNIADWIGYCDQRPDRSGANLSTLIPKFQEQGFRTINQLTTGGNRITVDKLSEWLSIRPGTADLIMGYAEEDCQLITAGRFEMELASGLVAAAE